MRLLAIDMGTGTQDILLLDTAGPVENSIKMVLPSATEIAARRIRRAHAEGKAIALTGSTMGGGPSAWAVDEVIASGGRVYATPDAARTFDDHLEGVERMGVRVVSDDEVAALRDAAVVELRDLDLPAIRWALRAFEAPLEWDGLAIGCLDHGAAPLDYSDRLFRFDHLRDVVARCNDLLAFSFLPDEVPDYLTRARSMLAGVDEPLPTVFLDTGPAAALGALQDERVAAEEEQVVLNLGNMHLLAFRLRGTEIVSLYEHHTGLLQPAEIERLTRRLMSGELEHEEVFGHHGHGVFYATEAAPAPEDVLVAATGPQRGKLRESGLQAWFAAPHGDMMISGCFGMAWAFAARFPEHRDEIARTLGLDGRTAMRAISSTG